MKAFTSLNAIAAPLRASNVDTDAIIPKLYLRTVKRTGLGVHLFDEWRYMEDGSENPDFVLNREPYRQAQILLAGANFGCGSSREHAVWALLDFGISCVIAPGFADIFYNNCFKNGVLPLTLQADAVESLMHAAECDPESPVRVNLEKQEVRTEALGPYAFDVDSFRRHCMLNGLDDIALTLEHESEIAGFEAADRESRPWLWS